jgi:hypothetical protein
MKLEILDFIKQNKWIILASIVFIAWKFLLITVLWHDRTIPPEPDDSFIYIAHIETVRSCSSFVFCPNSAYRLDTTSGVEHLSYRFIFGSLAKILHLNSFQVFHLSFYIGTLLMVPVLIYFLKFINQDKKIIAFSMLFLTLFNGSGSYHGFFWVVPSFFSFLLFLLIFAITGFGGKNYKRILLILTPIFAYMHSLGLYLIALVPIYYIIYSIFSKKWDAAYLKRIVFLIAIFSVFYFPSNIYLSYFSEGNPYGIGSLAKKVYNNTSSQISSSKDSSVISPTRESTDSVFGSSTYKYFGDLVSSSASGFTNSFLPGFKNIKTDYLDWVFLNWLGASVFLIMLIMILNNKQTKLLALYFTTLIFMLASTTTIFSNRSLIFIWPITFIVLAFGSWFSLKFFDDIKASYKFLFKIFAIASIGLFFYINLIYSFSWNSDQNKIANFNISSSFIDYIPKDAQSSDTIFMDPGLVKIYDSIAVMEQKALSYKRTPTLENSNFYIFLDYGNARSSFLEKNIFLSNFIKIIGFKKANSIQKVPTIPENFILEKELGNIKIYKNISI